MTRRGASTQRRLLDPSSSAMTGKLRASTSASSDEWISCPIAAGGAWLRSCGAPPVLHGLQRGWRKAVGKRPEELPLNLGRSLEQGRESLSCCSKRRDRRGCANGRCCRRPRQKGDLARKVPRSKRGDAIFPLPNLRRALHENEEQVACLPLANQHFTIGDVRLRGDRGYPSQLGLGAGFKQWNTRDDLHLLVASKDHGRKSCAFATSCTGPK